MSIDYEFNIYLRCVELTDELDSYIKDTFKVDSYIISQCKCKQKNRMIPTIIIKILTNDNINVYIVGKKLCQLCNLESVYIRRNNERVLVYND